MVRHNDSVVNISEDKLFEVTTKNGVTLTNSDLHDIALYWEASHTASHLMSCYGVNDVKRALDLAYEVHTQMELYGTTFEYELAALVEKCNLKFAG